MGVHASTVVVLYWFWDKCALSWRYIASRKV